MDHRALGLALFRSPLTVRSLWTQGASAVFQRRAGNVASLDETITERALKQE